MPTPFRRSLSAALAACLLSGAPLRAQEGGVLVASATARQVQWLDATAGQTRRITSVRGRPGRVAPFANGARAAVALDAVGAPVPSVAIFDGRTGRLLRDVPLVAADGRGLGAVSALVAEPGGEGCLLATEASSLLHLLGPDGSLEPVAELGEPGAPALAWGAGERTLVALLRAQGVLAELILEEGRVGRRLEVGPGSSLLCVAPDRARAWVANPASRAASAVDLERFERSTQFGMGASPTDLAFGPDGRQVFVTHAAAGTLTAYDARTGRVRRELFLGRATAGQVAARSIEGEATHTMGVDPGAVVLAEEGRALLVLARRTHEVLVLDPLTFTVVEHRPVAAGPVHLAVLSGPQGP
ncbi:MAG: hypothetical protein ISQ08_05955 [Planctomycetes bacterium]|nr:hypothetical protein [Planctomycetota bacterium]